MCSCKQNVEINFDNQNKEEMFWETANRFSRDIHQQLEKKSFIFSSFMSIVIMKNIGKSVIL